MCNTPRSFKPRRTAIYAIRTTGGKTRTVNTSLVGARLDPLCAVLLAAAARLLTTKPWLKPQGANQTRSRMSGGLWDPRDAFLVERHLLRSAMPTPLP